MRYPVKITVMFLLVAGLSWTVDARKAPECVNDGKEYGVVDGNFREEWYSYQERGESYLEGECWEAALSDFERAIELRTAVDRAADVSGCDQRRARTYGMHFEDWFGHRGKGIALYELDRIDEAIKSLETSLECTESSQAQFYLDKARKEGLENSGADKKDPTISKVILIKSGPTISFVMDKSAGPAPGNDRYLATPYYFTQDEVNAMKETMSRKERKEVSAGWGSKVISWKSADEVSGPVREGELYVVVETEDDHYVQTVSVQDTKSPYTFAQKKRADMMPLTVATSMPKGEEVDEENLAPRSLFAVPMDEDQGGMALSIAATDLMGKSTEKKINIKIDREGPQISIEEARTLPGGKAIIRGIVEEPSGIKSFRFGGETPKKVGQARFEVTAPMTGERVRFEAEDAAGNKTTGVIVLSAPTKGTMLELPIKWTKWLKGVLDIAALDTFDATTYTAPPQPQRWEQWSMGPPRDSGWFTREDTPLRLALDMEIYWNVLQEEMGIKEEPPKIQMKTRTQTIYSNQIYIEGSAVGQGSPIRKLLINGREVLNSPRTNAFFNKLMYLRAGKNFIKVEAEDENGLKSEELVAIHRVVPRVRTVAERLGVSMLPFYLVPDFMDIGEVASDNLATALIQQRRFRYVDRSKVDAAIREMKLSGTGLSDPTTAVRAGKMTEAEAIIMGVVRETPTSVEVKAQVVDVDSSRVMITKDAYHQDKSLQNLRFITRGLAVKLENSFPIVQGNIASTGRNEVVVNLGTNNRIIPGMKVVFFEVVPKTGEDGQPLGEDTVKIAEGSIESASSNSSTVKLNRSEKDPEADDLVITK